MTEDKIKRINELARKQKAEGLTDDEKEIILDGCLMNYYKKHNN